MNRRYLRLCRWGETPERASLGNQIPILKPYLKENESRTKSQPKTERHFDPIHRNRFIRGKDESIPISAMVTLPSFVTGLFWLSRRSALRSGKTASDLNRFLHGNWDQAGLLQASMP
jgi:hypothetical protein